MKPLIVLTVFELISTLFSVLPVALICPGILLLILKRILSVQIRPVVFGISIGVILFTGLVVGKDFIHNYLLASDTEIDNF